MGALIGQKIKKASCDVAIVKKEARVVISIDERDVSVIWNEPFRLNVIAVIGSGHIDGYECDEMVLCEVGVSRSRPYRIAEKPKGMFAHGEAVTLHKRRAYAKMTEAQYVRVAPVLFEVIRRIADTIIAGWKVNPDNLMAIKVPISWIVRNRKKINTYDRRYYIENGVRFSVKRDEGMLINDVHAAELFYNRTLKKQLEGLAKITKMYFRKFDNNKNGIPAGALEQFKSKVMDVSGFSRYLWIEMLGSVQAERHRPFYGEIAALLGWNGDETEERKLAASALLYPTERLGGIRLRLTNYHANQSIAVFEVFVSPDWRKYKIHTEEELPF